MGSDQIDGELQPDLVGMPRGGEQADDAEIVFHRGIDGLNISPAFPRLGKNSRGR